MKKYDAVVFDLDGTLLDTAEGVISSIKYAIKKQGLPMMGDEILRTFIGPPIRKSFERVYGMDAASAAAAAADFREKYVAGALLLATPYDGIFETIRALGDAGVKCGVATYKRQDNTDQILKHFGFDRICRVICGSDHEGKLTKKDIIENAIELMGVTDKKRAVMVGDSDNDALGAAAIGVDFIGVTYGFGFSCKDDVDAFANIGSADDCRGILKYII